MIPSNTELNLFSVVASHPSHTSHLVLSGHEIQLVFVLPFSSVGAHF